VYSKDFGPWAFFHSRYAHGATEKPILATSPHRPQCASRRDVARIGNFFAKGIKFLEEGDGREQLVMMGFGRNGAVVSLWSVSFFWFFFTVQFCELWGGKMVRNLPTGPPICTIFFLLSDSLTLDWYPTFNAALTYWHLIGIQISMLPLDKLKKYLELEKIGQITHLTSQAISKQTPCFPMRIVRIEEEVLGLLKTNYMPIDQEVEKRRQTIKIILFSKQTQAQDEFKYVGE
jgi:hypothetical protein